MRRADDGQKFNGYAGLYERATKIANGRAARLKDSGEDKILHKRILTQGWFRHDGTNLVRAFLTIGITFLDEQGPKPRGLSAPTPEDLTAPGGMTPESYTVDNAQAHKHFHEGYSEFGVRDSSNPAGIFMVSYGEYVKACNEINYEPFVKRAERLANFHDPFLVEDTSPAPAKGPRCLGRMRILAAIHPPDATAVGAVDEGTMGEDSRTSLRAARKGLTELSAPCIYVRYASILEAR